VPCLRFKSNTSHTQVRRVIAVFTLLSERLGCVLSKTAWKQVSNGVPRVLFWPRLRSYDMTASASLFEFSSREIFRPGLYWTASWNRSNRKFTQWNYVTPRCLGGTPCGEHTLPVFGHFNAYNEINLNLRFLC